MTRLRDQDQPAPTSAATPLTPSPLAGHWLNTNRDSPEIAKVEVREADGSFGIRIFDQCVPQPCDCGDIPATGVYGAGIASREAIAITGAYHSAAATRGLAINWNQGLLVVATYLRCHGAARLTNRFSREFFYRGEGSADPAIPGQPSGSGHEGALLAAAGAGSPPKEFGLVLGKWRNTNGGTRGIARLELINETGGVRLRVFGACTPEPCDWGDTDATVYSETPDSPVVAAFAAVYDFGFMEVQLYTYVVKGVLVVASFTRFKDGSGRQNYFFKEFLYRE